jgi:hypothetical protein
MAVGNPARPTPAAARIGSVAECIVMRAWAGSAPPSARAAAPRVPGADVVLLTFARRQKGYCVA